MVLIVVCTLRADHPPCYGYERDTAPFLAGLARESLVFENSLATPAWTAPTTASIHTSLYPFQHGVVSGMLHTQKLKQRNPAVRLNRIPESLETIAGALREAGYRTFAVTDNLNIVEEQGFAQA